ncbi:MAG: hypothetical protein ABIH01_02845, partial [Candidatus Omnitrophota bacterium]
MVRIKNISANFLLVIFSCALFFIIAEAGFKILHLLMDPETSPSAIAGLPYENTPNGWFIRYEPVNGWVKYEHNSLGMRDFERTFDKPNNVKRIVCLGDSVMYGGEVNFKDTFTQQREKRLNSPYGGTKVEVL